MAHETISHELDRNPVYFVTGAAGGLGSWVVRNLLDEGATVLAASRDGRGFGERRGNPDYEPPESAVLREVPLDLGSADSVRAAARSVHDIATELSPDGGLRGVVPVHIAGGIYTRAGERPSDRNEAWLTHPSFTPVIGALAFGRELKQQGIYMPRSVFVSSKGTAAAVPSMRRLPPLGPVMGYNFGKLAGEAGVRAEGDNNSPAITVIPEVMDGSFFEGEPRRAKEFIKKLVRSQVKPLEYSGDAVMHALKMQPAHGEPGLHGAVVRIDYGKDKSTPTYVTDFKPARGADNPGLQRWVSGLVDTFLNDRKPPVR